MAAEDVWANLKNFQFYTFTRRPTKIQNLLHWYWLLGIQSTAQQNHEKSRETHSRSIVKNSRRLLTNTLIRRTHSLRSLSQSRTPLQRTQSNTPDHASTTKRITMPMPRGKISHLVFTKKTTILTEFHLENIELRKKRNQTSTLCNFLRISDHFSYVKYTKSRTTEKVHVPKQSHTLPATERGAMIYLYIKSRACEILSI